MRIPAKPFYYVFHPKECATVDVDGTEVVYKGTIWALDVASNVHEWVVSPPMVLIPLYVRHVMHTFTENCQACSASRIAAKH